MEEIEFESRQVRRAFERMSKADGQRYFKAAERRNVQRELLARQTRREKEGFYYGRPVADAISPSRSRVTTRKVKKGQAFGRIIRTKFSDGTDGVAIGREWQFHATKGWRSYAAS